MCGRYLLDLPGSALARAFDAVDGMPGFAPRFNVAPTVTMPIISFDAAAGARVIEPAIWGLVPGWAWAKPGASRPLINARSETVAEKASFRHAFRTGRILVPAMGFYEWQAPPAEAGTKSRALKTPHLIRVRGEAINPLTGEGRGHDAQPGEAARPFTMAGIAETWVDDDGLLTVSYAILTTDANTLVAPIHDRMPVILDQGAASTWLHMPEKRTDELHDLLRPFDPAAMEAWPISRDVNAAANDGPHLVRPVSLM